MNETVWKRFEKAGPWAILAVLLIGFYLAKLDPVIDGLQQEHAAMRAEYAEQRAEAAAETKQLINVLGQLLMAQERIAYLQRLSCQHGAKTRAELNECAKDSDR